jgi:hypothetical protein
MSILKENSAMFNQLNKKDKKGATGQNMTTDRKLLMRGINK